MFDRIASAVRSDCVRRPIRLRPPSNRIAFAARSDCVRRPIRLRSPSGQIASAIYSYNHRMYTISIKSDSNTYVGCCGGRRPPLRFLFVPTVYLLLLIVVDLPFFAFASILYLKLRFR